MDDCPDLPKIEDITGRIEAVIRSGWIDSAPRSSRKVRQAALGAIVAAERVDPKKLHRPMTF